MVSVCHKTLSESIKYCIIIIFFPFTNMKFGGLTVRRPAFHTEIWGSIPPSGSFILFPTQDKNQPKAGFINFGLLKNLYAYQDISTSHRGCSTSQKHVQNPINPRGTFFGDQETFLAG